MYKSDAHCDGGDLDCGSGLLLIIKKSIDVLDAGQVLEVRSREKSVAEDLPAWCRMVEHKFLGAEEHETYTSYYVEKGGGANSVKDDLEAARNYKWSVRIRDNEGLSAKVFSRNHTLVAGQPAEFSAKVSAPSAIDYLLTSLGSCLVVGFKIHASKRNIVIDEMEFTLKAAVNNILYHLELEEHGSPKIDEITGVFYVTSPHEATELQLIWEKTLSLSPVYQTLKQAMTITLNFQVVL